MTDHPHMKIATPILNDRRGCTAWGRVHQKFFRLSEPLSDASYVCVSALDFAQDTQEPETSIFSCDAAGNIAFAERLPGSFRGAMDHEQALRNAGYVVTS